MPALGGAAYGDSRSSQGRVKHHLDGCVEGIEVAVQNGFIHNHHLHDKNFYELFLTFTTNIYIIVLLNSSTYTNCCQEIIRRCRIMERVYVAVRADFRDDGVMLPREITWEDGRKYGIDRVTDIRQAPSLKAGGQGDRYTVMIKGHQSYLFFERSADITGNNIGRWYVERRTGR